MGVRGTGPAGDAYPVDVRRAVVADADAGPPPPPPMGGSRRGAG